MAEFPSEADEGLRGPIGDVALDAGPGGAKEASDHVFRCSDGIYMT